MLRTFLCRRCLLLSLLVGISSAAGCGGQRWVVIHDGGAPSPLKGAGPTTVSFDYSQLEVGRLGEAAYVQSKLANDPGYAKTWAELKASFESSFLDGMRPEWPRGVAAGQPGPSGVHIVVAPRSMSMGHYMLVAATPTTINAAMTFYVAGQASDQIAITGSVLASVIHPSIFQHVPVVGVYIGRHTGRFLQSKG